MESNNNQIPVVICFFSLIFLYSVSISSNAEASPPISAPQPSAGGDPPTSYISAPSPQEFPSEYETEEAESPTSYISAPSPSEYPPESGAPSPSEDAPTEPPYGSPSPGPSSLPPPSGELQAVDPAIEKICHTTDNPALCVSSLAPFQNGKTDPTSVLQMAIQATTKHAKLALVKAAQLNKGSDATPEIQDCQETYNDVLDNLQSASGAIPARDTGTINSMLSAALTDFGTCDDGLGGGQSPLTPINADGTKLASMSLAISSLVK